MKNRQWNSHNTSHLKSITIFVCVLCSPFKAVYVFAFWSVAMIKLISLRFRFFYLILLHSLALLSGSRSFSLRFYRVFFYLPAVWWVRFFVQLIATKWALLPWQMFMSVSRSMSLVHTTNDKIHENSNFMKNLRYSSQASHTPLN